MTIIHADILDWAKTYTGPKFHALLCDPPYELGFMNRGWDNTGIAFQPSTWKAIGQHLYPGAFCMAFSSSRTYHRMAVAIEDAGFVLHPTIFGWGFGQGFPKATRVKYATCTCALSRQPTQTEHDMSDLPVGDVSQAEQVASGGGPILQPGMQEQSAPAKRPMPATRRTGRTQRGMEGRHNVQAQQGQLHWPEVRTVPSDVPSDGTQGWLHHGASVGDGADVRPDARPDRSGTPSRPQHQKQHADQSGAVAGQSQSQGVRTQQNCDRCGLPVENIFVGHRYGRQALKPALEPIIVFQKPYDGSPLACITSSGAGALWIDGSRIGTDDALNGGGYSSGDSRGMWSDTSGGGGMGRLPGEFVQPAGRWPANLILSHSPACNGECAPGCPVAALGAQSGESSSGAAAKTRSADDTFFSGKLPIGNDPSTYNGGDTDTAARFFFQADYIAERLELADAIAYVAKASRSEREAGLDPRQTAIMRLLDDSDDTPDFDEHEHKKAVVPTRKCATCGGWYPVALRRRPGSTCDCADPVWVEAFEPTTVSDGRETPIDNPYQRGETTRRNTHPTIKPIALARYLATLLLPPAQYGPRRLLIPFSGAGSEVIGADLAGWEDVTGVELGADHVAIANARRAYWQQRRWELGDPARKLTVKAAPKVQQGQVDMFVESEAA